MPYVSWLENQNLTGRVARGSSRSKLQTTNYNILRFNYTTWAIISVIYLYYLVFFISDASDSVSAWQLRPGPPSRDGPRREKNSGAGGLSQFLYIINIPIKKNVKHCLPRRKPRTATLSGTLSVGAGNHFTRKEPARKTELLNNNNLCTDVCSERNNKNLLERKERNEESACVRERPTDARILRAFQVLYLTIFGYVEVRLTSGTDVNPFELVLRFPF